MTNSLDPNKARPSVGPDLGPNLLQNLSADEKKLPLAGKELKMSSAAKYKLCFKDWMSSI